jgi:RNA polymerase sigma-70 factor (ECF subfamily)
MTLSTPIPTNDEAELVAQMQAGASAAFETAVRLHGPKMLAIAARYFHCEQDRDDAVQDAFISAFRAIGSFDGESKLGTWLHRITVNACLMKLRSRSRKPETQIDDLLPQFDDTGHRVHSDRAWDQDGYTRLAQKDTRQRVRDCIEQLPDSYRTVLMLRDIEGFDTAETAKQLDCSEANVKTRLHRARQALRTLLAPHFQESDA